MLGAASIAGRGATSPQPTLEFGGNSELCTHKEDEIGIELAR